jgi:hypothetical protein
VIELLEVTPAAEEGWWLLFELAETTARIGCWWAAR